MIFFLVPKPQLGNALVREAPASRKGTRSRGFECRGIPKLGLGNEEKKLPKRNFGTPDE
jgi:hypothetical protein